MSASHVPEIGDRVSGRYRITRRIGSGGFGVVFAGMDTALDRQVAIKLVSPSGEKRRDTTDRLLREARIMARLDHPGVVRLYDQGADPRFGSFLVMELLDGEDLAALLQRRGKLPPELALALMEQVCGALAAAHDAGVLHRDLKPSNIFVLRHTSQQVPMVKLLDFGAAVRARDKSARRDGGRLLGTLAYMAPERWKTADQPGVAADIYGMGTILFQMLTGSQPFSAPTRAGLRMAIQNDAAPLHLLSARTPALVRATIARSLDKRPEQRPATVREFAQLLGLHVAPERKRGDARPSSASETPLPLVNRQLSEGGVPPTAGRPTLDPVPADESPLPTGAAVFVGRHEAMATLLETVGRVEKGRPGLILIEGPSGIGKSALLEELRRRLDRGGNVLTLLGRAREQESVPFPALDDAINQLATYLLRLPPALAELLVPRRCGPLGHLFPVLSELPPIKRASEPTAGEGEPAENRRLASDGFRELLRRVGDRQPVILLLDDIQWLDPDSAALLERTFAGPEPPALLLIGALRDVDGGPRRELQQLVGGLPRETVTRIHLDVLSEQDAAEMARARWTGPSPLAARAATRMARLGRGVPFLIEMLATDPGKLTDAQPSSLEDVLIARRDALPARSRRALELLCISSRPIRLATLLEAVEAPGELQVIEPLLRATLARYTRLDNEWALEPHHARIRESLRRALHTTTRQAHHRRLATLLPASGGGGDVEATIEHLAGSGQTRAAAELARRAAEVANEQLAFDRAAALYEIVLEHGRPRGRERVAILQLQARALGHAGRRREAGATLLRAAKSVRDAATASALRRAAGSHLLASGDVAKALDVLRPALERLDVKLPADLAESAAATGAALQGLAARGLSPRTDGLPPDAEALDRVDLLLELALGLAHIDLRALPFACQALSAALDVGERQRLQRACALFVINTVEYVPTPLVAPALELCRELTGAGADPAARALLDAAFAENAHFEGDFLAAEAAFERAERTLLESGASASRELATVRDLAVFVQYAHKGDFRTQLGRTQHWLDQAEAAQDAFHAGMLRVAHAIVWIARDDTARARSDLRRAQTESIGTAGVLEVAVALYYDIIDRYEGDETALATSGEARSALLRSPAAQTPFLSGYLGLHAAWRKLRALGAGTAAADEEDAVCDIIARLRAPRMGIWSAVADALEGNLLFLRGGREAALRTLDQAEQTFRRLHMLCLAACVRKRRGQFVGGELGARLEAEAGSELSTLGVVDIERWTAAYWSMFDARAVADRTRDDLRADTSATWSGMTEDLVPHGGTTTDDEHDAAATKAVPPARRAQRTNRR